MEYYIFWARADGSWEGMCDEPFESREEAEAEIKKMQAEDVENNDEGWEYRIEEREPEDEDGDGELECGDYPDGRSVVCAARGGGLMIRRFASGYAREMWEIGMRESDFC